MQVCEHQELCAKVWNFLNLKIPRSSKNVVKRKFLFLQYRFDHILECDKMKCAHKNTYEDQFLNDFTQIFTQICVQDTHDIIS